jgi:hypothetical protein
MSIAQRVSVFAFQAVFACVLDAQQKGVCRIFRRGRMEVNSFIGFAQNKKTAKNRRLLH